MCTAAPTACRLIFPCCAPWWAGVSWGNARYPVQLEKLQAAEGGEPDNTRAGVYTPIEGTIASVGLDARKWRKLTKAPEGGTKLRHEALAQFLHTKLELSQEECDAMDLSTLRLRRNSYVQTVAGELFGPALSDDTPPPRCTIVISTPRG